jgi:histidine ammonia-lyase
MFQYGIDQLKLDTVLALARGQEKGILSPEAKDRILAARQTVKKMVDQKRPVYGVNTGFGPLCDTRISDEAIDLLQKNLLLTHAVGVGSPVTPELSRIMLICKIHALARGYSGIRLATLERMLYFFEQNLIPVVPEQGSVGASGDLAPLSHLFLPLLGEGYFWQNQEVVPAASVLAQHGLPPLPLGAKEGLALINGTQFILAQAIQGLDHMRYLLDLADVSGAMSLEAFQGSAAPFREDLHQIRPYPGNLLVARRMRQLLSGSENLASHANCERIQDPYSVRCIPQVHGASRNAWQHLLELTEIEMNAVTDNPIITHSEEAISGGNFHGQPLAMALDYATVAAAELGNIADRRCYLLLEGKNGLPRLLTQNGGLNSGLMIPQYTTAALVTENKTLCFPASADSIPTSLGQEDHVSMGSISGRKFNQVLGNLDKILAIELLYAAQGLEFRRPLRCSDWIEANFQLVRKYVPQLEDDRLLHPDIEQLIRMVKQRAFQVNAVSHSL